MQKIGRIVDYIRKIVRIGRKKWIRIHYKICYRKQHGSGIPKFLAGKSILFITPNSGGGTQVYCDALEMSQHWCILKCISYIEDFYYEVSDNAGNGILIELSELACVFEGKYERIIVNSLFGFEDYGLVLGEIIKYKSKHPETYLICNLHEFMAICPNYTLLNGSGFCRLRCGELQCELKDDLHNRRVSSLTEWRDWWCAMLERCDEIVCFSKSSADILGKIYPLVYPRIVIRPHTWVKNEFTKVDCTSRKLHIGVVGNCGSINKGRDVVREVIRRRDNRIPMTLIGIQRPYLYWRYRNVRAYGKYEHSKLQRIIESSGVTVILFPSVVPETFSFVLSEMMTMDLPIISLDVGAQGERVGKYEKGYVCRDVDEILETIQMFLRKDEMIGVQ